MNLSDPFQPDIVRRKISNIDPRQYIPESVRGVLVDLEHALDYIDELQRKNQDLNKDLLIANFVLRDVRGMINDRT